MSSTTTEQTHWLAKRLPFFYGWIILPIAILGTVATSPGQTFMISVFNPSFRETLHLSLSQLTGAYMAGTILAAIPQSYMGVWMDRLGIRRMLLLVVSIFGLACLFVSQARSLWMLFLAFLFLRMFGQGALELLSSNMLGMWFRKRLGTLTGIAGVITSVFIGVIPLLVLGSINQIGWRSTYILAGFVVVIVMAPLAFFFFINRPEEINQHLDGSSVRVNQTDLLEEISEEKSLTLRQALRTRSYWIVTLLMISWAAIGTGITFNLLPIFTAKGLTETQAATVFTTIMFISAGTRLLGGFLADRVPLRWLAVGHQVLYALGILFIIILPGSWVIAGYTILVGLAQGLFRGLNNTVWVRYFGRENLGKIRGTVATAGVAGSSVGPFLLGLIFDRFGSFNPALFICAAVMALLGIASIWVTPPKAAEST
jgi:MFS family permease